MREIKFRYWNGVVDKMVNDPKMPFKEGWAITQLFEERGWIWMQYTGLKDKNGVEIYEGDVVKCADLGPRDMPLIQRTGYIAYADNTCTFGVWANWDKFGATGDDSAKALWPMGNFRLSEFNVIGNIYETPELLN